jgi:RNA-binding protein YhbY
MGPFLAVLSTSGCHGAYSLLQSAPMKPTEAQKKYLRGLGHGLKPLIIIGEAGASESVLAEFESTLSHHELIKVSVRVGDKGFDHRETLCCGVCSIDSANWQYGSNLSGKSEKEEKNHHSKSLAHRCQMYLT